MKKYKKILIAIDDSDTSLKAVETGINLATQINAECAIAFVIDIAKTQNDTYSEELPHDRLSKLVSKATDTYNVIADRFPEFPFERFTPEKKPSEGIIEIAEKWNADLIVMGTQGKSGIKRLFIGSTAENTLRLSKIPILVVPNKD